jgi:hypothetical protein
MLWQAHRAKPNPPFPTYHPAEVTLHTAAARSSGERAVKKKALTSLMDPNQNGLRGLPKIVRFQLMVTLASLWSAIFCASAGLLLWLPGYLAVHVVLISIGIFGTSLAFWLAKKPAKRTEPTAKR